MFSEGVALVKRHYVGADWKILGDCVGPDTVNFVQFDPPLNTMDYA
jgi:hypothetical protein